MKRSQIRNHIFFPKKYPKFVFQKYSWKISKNNLEIFFDFKTEPDLTFQPKIIIKNINNARPKRMEEEVLDNLVFHLGLVEMLSYWKATCSPEIVIEAGYLDKEQIHWWKDLIFKGMGEFFFQNKIDSTKKNFLKITSSSMHPKLSLGRPKLSLGQQTLVPVGGGKDAVVTLEILKKAKIPFCPFLLNPKSEQRKILNLAKAGGPIVVQRTIDPKLLKLNRKGYLNGHTPFSAYLAFLSFLCAVLFNKKYIAFSNERSSEEGNVKYLGKIINHQYSKTFEFERKFRAYAKKYLAAGVEYFSFLRPLYELQITKLFSKHPKYLPAFLSCNVAHKTFSGKRKPTGKWCARCPKCLFVFAALFPFVKTKTLISLFNKNLFEDQTLIPLMEELVGERGSKPFECVGTIKESLVAFYLSLLKVELEEKEKLPILLQHFKGYILQKHRELPKLVSEILGAWDASHALPPNLKRVLQLSFL